jgi:hypothetical protein
LIDKQTIGLYKRDSVLTLERKGNLLHPTLTGLPGTIRDEFGNLKLKRHDGMRRRWAHAMRLRPEALTKAALSELLNWLRWGSQTGVMWECTAEELFKLVERWEEANPTATPEQYGVSEPLPPATMETLWEKRAFMLCTKLRFRCKRCNEVFGPNDCRCDKCGAERYLFGEKEMHGPRGNGSYNFALEGGDGNTIAAFALATRGRTRTVPILTMPPF